jgi:quercetin dioxygenase-like cupin family protein
MTNGRGTRGAGTVNRATRWRLLGAGLVLVAVAGCGNTGDDGAATAATTVQEPATEHGTAAHETPMFGPSEPRVAHADDSPTMMAGLDTVACLATSEQTGGAYSFLDIQIPAGSGPPPHQHDADEFFYVVTGTASIGVGELRAEVGPGDYFHVPRATTHSFQAITDVKLVAGYSPGGAEGPLFCDAAS